MGQDLLPKDYPSLKFQFFKNSTGNPLNLLILFHGLGDHEANFLKLGKSINLPQTAVVALRAPYEVPFLEDPAFMWWDSFDLSTGEEKNISHLDPSFRNSLSLISNFFDFAKSKGWRSEGIFAMGFSQGGTMALEAGLSCPYKIGGVLSMSGFPISQLGSSLSDRIPIITHELPILITIGDRDPKFSSASQKINEIKQLSKTKSESIQLEIIPGKGHQMSHRQDETLLWMKFFGRHLILSNPELDKMKDVYQVV